MKPFIVFIALVIVFTSLGVASTGLARYKQININLKALAEEIACGGGLMTTYLDDGTPVIDSVSANAYADFIISKAQNTPIFSAGTLEHSEKLENPDCRRITATVTYYLNGWSLKSILGFNPGGEERISRRATYEWVRQNGK